MLKKGFIIIFVVGLVGVFLFFLSFSLFSFLKEEEEISSKKQDEVVDNVGFGGIFDEFYGKAYQTLKKMSIDEKVGQLFLVRYDKGEAISWSKYSPGGYILFAKDFQDHTKSEMKKELDTLQKEYSYPLILGVDEEGGYVTRISRFPEYRDSKFLSPRSYYEEGGYELLEKMEKEKFELLKSIGINLNLAPVADISTDPDDFMYIRSFGADADKTSEFIRNMVRYAKDNQMNSCLKHFPGYGNNLDTHTGVAIDERSYESFLQNDFKPFQAGIDAGVPSILVSHNVVTSMDENYPSSLSHKVISELRDTLGFRGVIMTDDLAMDAVSSYVEEGRAATLAIQAGNDMIITSDFLSMREELLGSLKEGLLSEEEIDHAVLRVLAWKYYSGLL